MIAFNAWIARALAIKRQAHREACAFLRAGDHETAESIHRAAEHKIELLRLTVKPETVPAAFRARGF